MPLLLILLLCLVSSCTSLERRQPGSVVMALDEAPQNLDPRIGIDATSERLIQLMFSSLVRRTPEFTVEPDLALSWDIPNPTTYIFHLREDALFHDGRKVTARDVVFTFRSLLDGSVKSTKRGTFRLVQSVEATDERTVIFKLKEPFAPFLWNLTRGGVGIVPEGSAQRRIEPYRIGRFQIRALHPRW